MSEQQPKQQISEEQAMMRRQSMFQSALDSYNKMCAVLLMLPIHPNTPARTTAFLELEGAILRFKEMMVNGPLYFAPQKKTDVTQETKSAQSVNDAQIESQPENPENKLDEVVN